jgi:hypothetical protein
MIFWFRLIFYAVDLTVVNVEADWTGPIRGVALNGSDTFQPITIWLLRVM